MMIRFLKFLIIVTLLVSCKESEQDKVARLVNEWNGKVIHLFLTDQRCVPLKGTKLG